MRIIAGSKRGMKLLPPKGMATRPITDRVKESLFSILVNRYDAIEQSRVADLFCGTGSLGLEALSRGAQNAIFIDRDSRTTAILEKNIARANFVAESKVIRANAFKIGAPTPASGEKFDLVFVDPPYLRSEDTTEKSQLGRLLTLLNEQIAPDGIAVVRTHETTALLDKYDQLQIIERRAWGTMAVAIMGFGD
jgi:16S rRNA (guanine(966)-N(2))-methyltransferase RsmD